MNRSSLPLGVNKLKKWWDDENRVLRCDLPFHRHTGAWSPITKSNLVWSILADSYIPPIVLLKDKSGVDERGKDTFLYNIEDGQQRLTTVSLLMLAIHRLLEEGTVQAEQKNLASLLLKKYLIDEFENDSQKIKLKPIKDDQRAFISLFDTDAEQIVESNLTINYRYFRDRIQRQEISIDALYSAISKLQIINITLNHEDDPQLIFESLNSTGLALSEGDKIRNYILMGLSLHEQEVYYTKYWNEIEKNTGYDVSSFVRDYLSIKQQMIPNLKNVYPSFKNFRQEAERNG